MENYPTGKNESLQNRVNHTVGALFLILCFALMLLFVIGQIFFKSPAINRGWVKEYKGVWNYETPGGLSGTFIAPDIMEIPKRSEVTFWTTLPDDLTDGSYFALFTGRTMDVYVDDELRYQFREEQSGFPGGIVKAIYFFVPMSAEDAGRTLTVHRFDTEQTNDNINEVLYGDYPGLLRYLLDHDALKYFSTFFLFLLAIGGMVISIYFWAFRKNHIAVAFLAFGTYAVSSWILLDSYLFQFIFRNYGIDGLFAYMTIMLVPYPFIRYLDIEQKERHQKLYLGLEIFLLIQFIALMVLHYTNVWPFTDSQPLMNAGLAIVIGLVIVTCIMEWIQGYVKEYYLLGIGLMILMISGIIELLMLVFVVRYSYGTSVIFGLYALNIMAGCHAISQMIERERQTRLAITANEMKTSFLANMSHEIRTPINAIKGMNEMVLRESNQTNVLEYASNIEDASENLLAIVNDILDFSKIESGHMDIRKEKYKVRSVLSDVIHMTQIRASQKHLEFRYDISDVIPAELIGDETRIRQILLNLLNNAVKYTHSGSVTLRVSGSFPHGGQADDYLLNLEVTDTGIGIREEDQTRLFQSFERLDREKNRSIEGTGLGLAITGRLVERMEGDIELESEYGSGSTFTVVLPQKVLDPRPMGPFRNKQERADREYSAEAGFTAPEAKILVVDDNDMNLYVVRRLLEETEVQVTTCTGAEEMFEAVREECFDVILLDIMMPQIDGVEALQKLKKLEGNRSANAPVIALTANALVGAREQYLEQGFDDYMSKPIEGAVLESTIAAYLPKEKILHK